MNNARGHIHLASTNVELNRRAILHDVMFHANPGDVHCVIGANGSGKSTLLRVLSGDIPVKGLMLNETDMNDLSISERARIRSVLRPSVRPDFPYLVSDIVAWALLRTRSPQPEKGSTSDQVLTVLGTVGIAELADRPVTQLSTGQLTKVNIASVLLQNAGIVFADEPEAALDPVARIDAWNHLTSGDFTAVIATHSLDLVMQFATHITAVKAGRVVFTAQRQEVTIEDLQKIYAV